MWPLRVVEHPPLLDQYLRLPKRVKQLPIQQLIPELAVERFTVAVLPWAARRYVDRLCAQAAQPVPESLGDHFRAIVRAYVLGDTVGLHQVGKDIDRIPAPDAPRHVNSQALPGILIDDHHQLDRASVMGSIKHEVPRPHMVAALWSEPDAGAVIQPQPAPFGLLLRDPEPLAPPDTHDPAMADRPALRLQQGMHPAVAIPPVLAGKAQDIGCQGRLVFTRLGNIPDSIAGNAQRLADAPLGVAQ